MQGPKVQNGCIFCCALDQEDSQSLIVHHGKTAYVILNRYPYTNGHLMIVPNDHKSSLEDLAPETRAEMMELLSKAITVLRKVYKPQGLTLAAILAKLPVLVWLIMFISTSFHAGWAIPIL